MATIKHAKLPARVDEVVSICAPDAVVWVDGSEEEKKRLERRGIARGQLIPLDQEKFPGSYYSRSNSNDVARTEHLPYICTKDKEAVGPTNHRLSPEEGY